ncbi:MAG: metalloregulator ArsR/SmtB family transcription factor [Rubrobacteraceae bacterium]
MQDNVVKLDVTQEFTVGRESEDMFLLARFFNGFANSTRLSILLLLADQGEMRVGDLVVELDAPQPRISDHLRCLAQCGYVQARRSGRRAYYSITDDRVLEMLSLGESLLRDNLEHVEACDEVKQGL